MSELILFREFLDCEEGTRGGVGSQRAGRYTQKVKRTIEALLAESLDGRVTVSYSQLAAALGEHYRNRGLYSRLDKIQRYCSERGYPSLPVMVGRKKPHRMPDGTRFEHMPGDGFFVSYECHFPCSVQEVVGAKVQACADVELRKFIVERERERVRRRDWGSLINEEDFSKG